MSKPKSPLAQGLMLSAVVFLAGSVVLPFSARADDAAKVPQNDLLDATLWMQRSVEYMLPNPEYGSWESAAFGGNYKLSLDERRKMKIDALQPWAPK